MPDVYFAPIEMNGSNQPNFVATDVKDNQITDFVGRGNRLSQFHELLYSISLTIRYQRCNALAESGYSSQNCRKVLRDMMCMD